MLEIIFEFLRELGWIGLVIGVSVEGLSVPFPAAIVFLVYGYVMNPAGLDFLWLSLLGAGAYTVVSYIPYVIAVRWQHVVQRRMTSVRVKKMIRFMERNRNATIAIGRTLGMGYIVYVAAVCRIGPVRYGIFTFLGVFVVGPPMLYLGSLGNVGEVYAVFQQLQYVIAAFLLLGVGAYLYFWIRKKRRLARHQQRGGDQHHESARVHNE
ncbi:hypothetical protein [Alkalicoccus chagannorensis]|uniref:hypothetical protein n=1 Tax=Alkalicoccus chagannorensis TaxID=427072 RepID=UPI0003F8D0DB|nr:hypothetical protein [Alkalicoccus chagannorensis]